MASGHGGGAGGGSAVAVVRLAMEARHSRGRPPRPHNRFPAAGGVSKGHDGSARTREREIDASGRASVPCPGRVERQDYKRCLEAVSVKKKRQRRKKINRGFPETTAIQSIVTSIKTRIVSAGLQPLLAPHKSLSILQIRPVARQAVRSITIILPQPFCR